MTGKTITEKIIDLHEPTKLSKGGLAVDVDVLLTHDVCGPPTIGYFKQEFGEKAIVFDREGVVIIPDHYIFTKDETAGRNVDVLRQFVKEQELPYFYDKGTKNYKGVCHVALPEEGHVGPGMMIIGTDSHTCTHGAFGSFAMGVGNTTAAYILGSGHIIMNIPESLKFNFDGFLPEYVSGKDVILRVIGDIGTDGADFKSMEFEGDAISALSLEERATICNMAIEAGGNGIIAPDEATRAYVERFGSAWLMKNSDRIEELFSLQSDDDAKYLKVLNYDAEKLEPMVALPHSPGNVKPVRECEGARMDSVYIGSCTGGKSEDFLMAAQILVNGGREVKVPLYIVPATNKVVHYIENKKIGDRTLKEIFENAGANMDSFYQPSCAACLGGPIDTYGRINNQPNHFRASTTNRNFPKRMGSGNIFLVSPMTAAATAMKGTLCDPRVYVR